MPVALIPVRLKQERQEVEFTSTGRVGGMGVRMISYRSEESYVEFSNTEEDRVSSHRMIIFWFYLFA